MQGSTDLSRRRNQNTMLLVALIVICNMLQQVTSFHQSRLIHQQYSILLNERMKRCIYESSTKLNVKNLASGDYLAELGSGPTNSPRIRRERARVASLTASETVSLTPTSPTKKVNTNGNGEAAVTKSQKRIIPQGLPRLQELNNPNKLRILGGKARGRKIDSPNVYLRPMMAKVREAVFNTLTYLQLFAPEKGTRVLDIFAGAGSVGLESISRGAAHATFVDLASECTDTVLRNAEKCGFSTSFGSSVATTRIDNGNSKQQNLKNTKEGEVKVVTARAEDILAHPTDYGLLEPYHFVSLTPPYQEVSYPQLLSLLCTTPLLMADSIVMLEYPMEMGTLPAIIGDQQQLIGLRNRRYGRTVLAIYVFRPSRHYDMRPEEFIEDVKRTNGHNNKP